MSWLSKLAVRAAREAAERVGGDAVRAPARRAERAAVRGAEREAARAAPPLAGLPRAKPKVAPKPTPAARPVVRALPAPERQLALPPPAAPLPAHAAKPRGGQWPTERSPMGEMSPEVQAREATYLSERFSGDPTAQPFVQWWDRALPKYLKTDFGTENDPLRNFAVDAGLADSPDAWSEMAKRAIQPTPIGDILLPNNPQGGMPGAGSWLRGSFMRDMPWLAKQPVTDPLYGLDLSALGNGGGLTHIADEMRNALNPAASGIPADLAVRPEALQRMSFPQAAERVGRINQWRAQQMEQASLAAMDNPAIRPFKEYPDAGMRWVQLAAPEPSDELLDELDRGLVDLAVKEGREIDPAHMEEVRASRARRALEDALKHEGDTMGHCVGGYCDEVMSGLSSIYSLRDAKGQPHVTIEASPRGRGWLSGEMLNDWEPGLFDQYQAQRFQEGGFDDMYTWFKNARPDLYGVQDIVQIKGKQNRAPNDEYLPYVQDFVKSGQWGQVGDLGNAKLDRLPDGRFITEGQLEEGINRFYQQGGRQSPYYRQPENWDEDTWQQLTPYFEGFAVGGRVAKKDCGCAKCNSFAVRGH